MCVMLAQNLWRKLLHLHGNQFETAFFKTRDYLTDKPTLNSAWLQYYKCSFHAAKIVQAERRKKGACSFFIPRRSLSYLKVRKFSQEGLEVVAGGGVNNCKYYLFETALELALIHYFVEEAGHLGWRGAEGATA